MTGDWSGRSFHGEDFEQADLMEESGIDCVFEECDFTNATLAAARFERCAFLRCNFRRTRFFGTHLLGCKLSGSTFIECDYTALTVEGGDWSYVLMRSARLEGICLGGVRLRAKLRGADLRGANLEGVDLKGLDFSDASIDIAQAVQIARAFGAIVE